MSGYGCGYTAMLTSLVVHDPGHLLGLAAQVPRALGRLTAAALTRLRGRRPERADLATADGDSASAEQVFPAELARAELVGYLHGPLAYLRSWRARRSRAR
jgi:hypothetical protein